MKTNLLAIIAEVVFVIVIASFVGAEIKALFSFASDSVGKTLSTASHPR